MFTCPTDAKDLNIDKETTAKREYKPKHLHSCFSLVPLAHTLLASSMASSLAPHQTFNPSPKENREEEDYEKTYHNYNQMLQTLPKAKGWRAQHVVKYQSHWLSPNTALKGALLLQNHFKPKPTDTFLAAFMKSGTTWLRSLLFATINRSRYDFSSHPLLTTGPHAVFPFLDSYIYDKHPIADLDSLPSPRLFATHFSHDLFPESVKASSGSKFVYIWRDPKDVLVSKWHFMNRLRTKDLPVLTLHEAFELFCDGVSEYGPFWDHVLGYWNASVEAPDKVLILKYEEVKREPGVHVQRLAEFMGVPFSVEEKEGGVVGEIVELCSFDKLRNLEVNKTGVSRFNEEVVVQNRDFFRKGEVGDGVNYLTEEMIERLDRITERKFEGTGLEFGALLQ